MEELGPVVVVVAYIILMLLSKLRKKELSKTRPRAQKPRVQAAEPRSDVSEAEFTSTVRRPQQPSRPRPKRSLAEELLSMFEEQAEPKPEPPLTLPEIDDEAVSLELIEPRARESHERFRRKYVEGAPGESAYAVEETQAPRPYEVERAEGDDAYEVEEPTSPQPYAADITAKRKKHLSRSELRHAFIMREVLGPPKALE